MSYVVTETYNEVYSNWEYYWGHHCERGSHQRWQEEQINTARGPQSIAPVLWAQLWKDGPFSLWASTCDRSPWSLPKPQFRINYSFSFKGIVCSPYYIVLYMKVKWVKIFKELRAGLGLGQVSVQESWASVTITIIKFSGMHTCLLH